MLKFVKAQVRGILSLLLFLVDTLVLTVPFYTVALLKWLIPLPGWRRFCTRALHRIGDVWLCILNLPQKLSRKTRWVVRGLESVHFRGSCLLMINHQTWADIMVLIRLFHRRIPDFKFFVKKELLWLPIVGQAFWAVDFPIMRRYSPEVLKRRHELKGKDLEMARNACRKFRDMPVSIFDFVEGTRFSRDKHERQGSPFRHLLRPRAGGIALVLGAMGEMIHDIVDVTIVYPRGVRTFWDYLCGMVEEIRVHVERIPVTADLIGDYTADGPYRAHIRNWLNGIWREKDRRIDEMLLWQWQTGA
jgi:1-acyl-sn-glycerol-3-phosphate acyltransferase